MNLGTPLKNYQHERFAMAIVKGMNHTQAAIYAGYKMSRAMQTGHELVRYSKIIERIEQLHELTASPAIMDVKERKEKLSEIGRGRLIDFVKDDEPVLTQDIPNVGAAAEFSKRHSVNKLGGEVVTRSIKLHNPMAAIGELNKMEHIYEERVPVGTTIVNTFMFILPGGKRVRPQELREVNTIEADEVIE